MTFKDNKKQISVISGIVALLAVAAVSPVVESAYAASDCSGFFNDRCRGTQTNTQNHEGMKADVVVTNFATSSNCDPSGDGFAAVSIWMIYPNGAWIEIGTAQGQIDGSCYSDEREYLAWTTTSSHSTYTEEYVRNVGVGNDITYEISDTNGDKTWKVISEGITRKNLVTAYLTGTEMQTGLEATDDQTSIPKTTQDTIKYYDGSSWNNWTSGSNSNELDGWIRDCSSHSSTKVGVGGTAGC